MQGSQGGSLIKPDDTLYEDFGRLWELTDFTYPDVLNLTMDSSLRHQLVLVSLSGSALSSFSIVSSFKAQTHRLQCPDIRLVSLAGAVHQQSSLLIVLGNAGLRDSGGRDPEVTPWMPPKETSRFSIIFLDISYTMISMMTLWEKTSSCISFVFLLGFMSVGLVAGHWGEILCGQGRRIWHEENVARCLQIQRSNGGTENIHSFADFVVLRFRIPHVVLQGSEQALPSRSRRKVTRASHITDRGDEAPTVPADDIHWLKIF